MHPVLDLPMGDNDAKAATVRDYLKKLLSTLLEEDEGFSGKRPFGNSGWIGELEKPLVVAGVVPGKIDQDGYLEQCDSNEALKVLLSAVAEL